MLRSGPIASIALAAALIGVSAPACVAGVISDAGAVPNPFSPNGDGVYDECTVLYTLSDSDWIVVSVEDTLGASIAVLSSEVEEAGSHSHTWDGGGPEPDGHYSFVIESLGDPERVVVPVVIDTKAPTVLSFETIPSRFTPDGDGLADSLLVRVSLDSSEPNDRAILSVLDEDHEPVVGLADVSGVDSLTVYWTGLDDAGAAAGDAFYLIYLETMDAAGNVAESSALIDVDADPPHLGVDLPDTSFVDFRIADTTAVISGWAYDRSGVLAVEMTLGGEEWFELSISGDDTVRWEHTVTCTACASGASDEVAGVSVRARDGVATADGEGHMNTADTAIPVLSFDVVYDVAGPALVASIVQDDDDVYLAGQTISVKSQWDDSGYTLAADFSEADSEFELSAVEVSDIGGGIYSVEYTLSDGNVLAPVYGAGVRITATDTFDRSFTDDSVSVTVLAGTGEPDGLMVDRNSFNPALDERLSIETSADVQGLKVEIFNMAGVLVRSLGGDGGTAVEWDGRNEDDDVVASGVYFLSITTDGEDAVRKVAVVK